MKFDCRHLKTEASFIADDPWNQNRRTSFTIDFYVYVNPGARVRPNSRMAPGFYGRGIRSELSSLERDLPDCLYYMWRGSSIPAEVLPRLLHELQPTLKTDDYGIMLSNRQFTVLTWILGILFGLATVSLWGAVLAARIEGGFPLWLGTPMAALLSYPLCRVFYSKIYQAWRRRMEQTKWILSRV